MKRSLSNTRTTRSILRTRAESFTRYWCPHPRREQSGQIAQMGVRFCGSYVSATLFLQLTLRKSELTRKRKAAQATPLWRSHHRVFMCRLVTRGTTDPGGPRYVVFVRTQVPQTLVRPTKYNSLCYIPIPAPFHDLLLLPLCHNASPFSVLETPSPLLLLTLLDHPCPSPRARGFIYHVALQIVVSPLVSLMEDQMANLPPRLVGASLSGSHGGLREVAGTVRDLRAGRIKVCFLCGKKQACLFQRGVGRMQVEFGPKRKQG